MLKPFNLQLFISGSGWDQSFLEIQCEVLLFTKLAEKCIGITEGSEDNKGRRFNRMNYNKRLSQQSLFPPERREPGNTMLSLPAPLWKRAGHYRKQVTYLKLKTKSRLPVETRCS